MKLVKMLGLAMIAAIASMAFMGTSSALAVHLVVLCKVHPEVGKLCPEGQLYKTGTVIKGTLEKLGEQLHAVLLGSAKNDELCETSEFEGKITKTSPLHGELTKLTFGNCTPCPTVTVENLPYLVTVTHDEEPKVHLWLLKFTKPLGKVKVKFSGGICALSPCVYEATEVHLDAENRLPPAGETPLILTLENVLTKNGGVCDASGKWDANYVVTAPTPSYLALDEKIES